MLKSQTKIIIRNLPRCLSKEQFLKEIENFNIFNYFRFCGSEKYNKSLSNRAYINFYNEDDMYEFKNLIESKPFFDETGIETYCIVEFAVFQRIPGKSKTDSKQSTLSSDPEFVKFLEDLKEPPKNINIGTAESNLEEIKNKEADKSVVKTPLIEFLSNNPKKEKLKKDDYRRKMDYSKPYNKKDIENTDSKIMKVENVINKKNMNKEALGDVLQKNELKNKPNDKLDIKRTKPAQRNDIKAYAAAYEDYEYERGFENKSYRSGGGRSVDYEGDEKGSYYYNSRYSDSYYNSGRNYNYAYSDYPSHHGSYSRAPPSSTKNKRGGGRRPPAYSATRKD